MKTIAQQCREAPDPHEAATGRHCGQSRPYGQNIVIYHFEDGSTLEFAITYTATAIGESFPCRRPNTI